jgi:hypothetical protein
LLLLWSSLFHHLFTSMLSTLVVVLECSILKTCYSVMNIFERCGSFA